METEVGFGVGVEGFTTAVVVGDAAGVGVGVGVGVVLTTTLTSSFQTNFLPDLMHVNFTFATIEVAPTLEHVAPGLVIEANA
jgi:uncharacterized membrane protein YhiD involved in acid resistance